MDRPLRVFFVTLEQSAETIVKDILHGLQQIEPNTYLEGVGSKNLAVENAQIFLDSSQMQVMGLIDVICSIPRILNIQKKIKKRILEGNFDLVITVDSSSFNIPLVKSLKKGGCKAKFVHAVCPPIWAYRPKRKEKIVQTFDLLLPLFKFEVDLFKDTPLNTVWLGHPLKKIEPIENINAIKDTICIFPGSRKQVIKRNLPLQIRVAKQTGLKIVISVAAPQLRPLVEQIAPGAYIVDQIPTKKILEKTAVALATSGTITLELALYKIPLCVTYKIPLIDAIAAKLANLKIDQFSLPNILSKERVIEEHVHPFIQERNLLKSVLRTMKTNTADIYKKLFDEIAPAYEDGFIASKLLCLCRLKK
jgi:lipid-A-disaccharide synthase